jgi:hypothetical protein
MPSDSPSKTLADYVAIAISPVLIMALVGSLVFFLLEVLYVGQYQGRLQWILFFFVFGAVLIARISMTAEIAGRAGLYGLVLGFLVWLALLLYVKYPPGTRFAEFGWAVNLFLIAVIWWSAHRLTWDCTLIDDSVDASGAGLLEAAGLEQGREAQPAAPGQEPSPEEGKDRPGKKAKVPSGLLGWWHRYRKYREQQERKPHAPGVWVVYFSLAALPLFGLGQLLLGADRARDEAQRAASQRYVFFLMTVYVGSGLGLLLTTSFLGLRRYLRQRKVKMPAAVKGAWLFLGGLLAAALLLLGGFLPRPSAGPGGFLEWAGLTAPERKGSQWAREDGEGAEEGKGAGAKGKQAGKGKDKGSGQGGQGSDKEKGAKGGSGGKSAEGSGKAGQKSGGKDGRGKGGDKSESKGKQAGGGPKDDKEAGQGGQGQEPEQGDNPDSPLPEVSPALVNALKWIVGILVVLAVLFLVLRKGLSWLANFTHWARQLLDALRALWAGLWGGGGGKAARSEQAEAERAPPPRPFASFRDPFRTGEADGLSAEALVRYSFEALEAWAAERRLARRVGETALEFVERLGEEFPALEADARRLADLVAGLAYAPYGLEGDCRKSLRQFWRVLVDAVERPLSAGVGSP